MPNEKEIQDLQKFAGVKPGPKITVTNQVMPNPENPIPFRGGQSFFYIPNGKNRYVPYWSDTDQFANLLLESRLLSTTHGDCIDTISQCAVGDGLYVLDVEKPEQKWLDWAVSVNNYGNSLNKVLKNAVDGYEMQGNQFIEIVRGKVGNIPFLKVYPQPMQNCRLVEPGNSDIPTAVYVTKYFSRNNDRLMTGMLGSKYLSKARQIPLWTPNSLDQSWVKNDDNTESTMIHLKNEYAGVDYYGLPASIGSLLNQIKESLMVQFDNDNLQNGMVPGGVLGIKGSLTRSEVGQVAQDILLTHTGRGKTGRIMVLASEQGIGEIEFKQFDTQKEGSFIEADKRNEAKIRAANKVPMELSSSLKGGGLASGGDSLLQAWNNFEAFKLKPIRTEIANEFLSKLAYIFADWYDVPEIKQYKFGFRNPMSMLAFLTLDPKLCVTVNEARAWLGLPVDKVGGDRYMGEIGARIASVPGSKEGGKNV